MPPGWSCMTQSSSSSFGLVLGKRLVNVMMELEQTSENFWIIFEVSSLFDMGSKSSTQLSRSEFEILIKIKNYINSSPLCSEEHKMNCSILERFSDSQAIMFRPFKQPSIQNWHSPHLMLVKPYQLMKNNAKVTFDGLYRSYGTDACYRRMTTSL